MAKVLALLLISTSLHAEYRAYQLSITKDGNSRDVITNFDHNQYPGVHPLNEGEVVEYVDSWMCWGSQGVGVPPCPNPKNPQPTSGSDLRAPASVE